ncbi:MAG: hypothetical protein ACM3ZF_14405, partial [Mycobacterium leprae]
MDETRTTLTVEETAKLLGISRGLAFHNVFEIDHEDWRAPTGAARGREPAGGPSARPSPTSPWLRSA